MISDSGTPSGTLRAGGRAHSPEQIARIPLVGTWLLIGADFFFVLPLFFAFFFLQATNNNDMWQPKGVHPPNQALGVAAFALVVLGVVLAQSGLRHLQSQSSLASFTNIGRLASLLLLASVVVNIWQLSHVGYGISSGTYASCFFAMQIVITIEVAALALWVLSLANRAGYESNHPITMPPPDGPDEVATPISALARSYEMFAVFVAIVVGLAWVVCYFL
jgi:heme/copper-type cytochrome/quinol oxidase subunit 3